MTKFVYYNDTNRMVTIHPATTTHGCEVDMRYISPLEERVFILPKGTYPWMKMWDNGSHIQILVSPRSLENDEGVNHEPINDLAKTGDSLLSHFVKINPHDKKEK